MKALTTQDERRRRETMCNVCPHAKQMARTRYRFCELCGCPLASKTRFQGAKCPAGKW